MAHLHELRDMDTHFVIDPVTRVITNPNSQKNKLMQGDHNSEIYTFEIPKLVEGHDMSLCNQVRIHYNDIASDKANESKDVYIVNDLHIDLVESDTITFSWLISGNATKYAGLLSFRIQFLCIDESGAITYKWHTEVFKGITISDGFDNAEAAVEDYSDVIAVWEARLDALEWSGLYIGDFKRTPVYNCLNIYLDGDTTGMTKDNAVMLDILILDEYGNVQFDGKSKTAWQGSGSLSYPNKNLSLKLRDKFDTDSKVELSVFPEYATSTYHLKCNYADYSMVRNSVGARMAMGFDDTAFPVDAPMVVHSVPAIVYLNGAFNGCYTLNTKQDDLLFGMDTKNNPLTQIVYRSGLGSWTMSNFEYRSDGTETAEVKAKLQRLMDFCQNADDETFVSEFENYLSLRNTINYWIFADVACASDSMINNWTIATWDGAKWYMLWYDLDIIFGLFRNGGISYHPGKPTSDLLNLQYTVANPLWAKLYRNFFEEIKNRYWELRNSGALTPTAIVNKFRTFQAKWGSELIQKDRAKWADRPNKTDDIDMMYSWISQRLDYLDGRYSDHTLPGGYTRLSYIEGTGTQYINTEKTLFASDADFDTADDGFLIDFAITKNSNGPKMIFGATNRGANDLQVYYWGDSVSFQFLADTKNITSQLLKMNNRHTIQIGLNTLYDGELKNNTWLTDETTGTLKVVGSGMICTGAWPMTLMAQNPSPNGTFDATSISDMRLYECWYKQNGVYVIHLIPALDPEGRPCMFDLVAQKPYYNAGTGEFIYAV